MLTGRIYKITNNVNDLVYIGATIQSLHNRFLGHKRDYKRYGLGKKTYVSSFDLFDSYGVNDCKIELIKEYQIFDKTQLRTYEHLWLYQYKNKIINKVPAFSIPRLTQRFNYYKNQEESRARNRTYRNNNKEVINDRAREFYYDNQEKILLKGRTNKFLCDCGTNVRVVYRAKHKRSPKHIRIIEENKIKAEQTISKKKLNKVLEDLKQKTVRIRSYDVKKQKQNRQSQLEKRTDEALLKKKMSKILKDLKLKTVRIKSYDVNKRERNRQYLQKKKAKQALNRDDEASFLQKKNELLKDLKLKTVRIKPFDINKRERNRRYLQKKKGNPLEEEEQIIISAITIDDFKNSIFY